MTHTIKRNFVLKLFLFFIVAHLTPLAYAQSSIDVSDADLKGVMPSYEKANSALENGDFIAACQFITKAKGEFITGMPTLLKRLKPEISKQDVDRFVSETLSKIDPILKETCNVTVDDLKWKGKCVAYKAMRFTCASAGNYDTCMSIRFGREYKKFENSCE